MYKVFSFLYYRDIRYIPVLLSLLPKQGRKSPLDTPKRMIERREREMVEGEI